MTNERITIGAIPALSYEDDRMREYRRIMEDHEVLKIAISKAVSMDDVRIILLDLANSTQACWISEETRELAKRPKYYTIMD